MMKSTIARAMTGVVALSLIAGACSDDDEDAAPVSEDAESSATTDGPMADDGSTTTMMTEDTTAAGGDIVDTAVAAGDFETLVTAVQAAGLEETLHGEGPFTVFAPTDDAFAALPEGTLDTLLADPEGDLTDILTYHVVEGAVPAADVVGLDGQEVPTVNGAPVAVAVGTDDAVTLTDAAGNDVAVTQTDIETSNGVIHVIDGVLLPG